MADLTKKRLRLATIVYWTLLLYMIAALVWWSFSLLQQNKEIHELKKTALGATATPAERRQIESLQRRGVYKYVGEAGAVLLLISVGAVYIYRSVRRQFRLQLQQQNFVMAVTHELKTPIAVSRLNLETLQKYSLEEEKRKKLLQMTLQETLRLDTLINNILISSQLEGNAYRIAKEALDFSALVKESLKGFCARYPDRPFTSDIAEHLALTGDAVLLKLLLSNLLENANKYSPKGRTVHVTLGTTARGAVLSVTDEGEGIPDDEKKAVFEKFYRIGNEQTRRTQGTGLGLYICQRIVRDHGGEITVKDNHPAGTKFIVQFHS